MAGHMFRHTSTVMRIHLLVSLKEGESEVSQVLFRLSRWENLEYAKKI